MQDCGEEFERENATEKLEITEDMAKKQCRKTLNWKAPGSWRAPKSDVDRIYVSIEMGGWGLISYIAMEENKLGWYGKLRILQSHWYILIYIYIYIYIYICIFIYIYMYYIHIYIYIYVCISKITYIYLHIFISKRVIFRFIFRVIFWLYLQVIFRFYIYIYLDIYII